MHFPNFTNDENADKNLNLLPYGHRFLHMPASLRATVPPRLMPIPQSPLLAMQLMMLRVKNSTSDIHQLRDPSQIGKHSFDTSKYIHTYVYIYIYIYIKLLNPYRT